MRGIAAVSSCLPKSAGPLSSSVRANALPRRGRSDPRRQRRRTGIACARGAHCCFPNLVARINPRGQGGDGTIDVWAPQRDGVACPPSVTPIYLKNCSTTVEIPIGCWQGRRCYEAPLCTAVAPVMMALILSASGAPSTTRAQKRATPSTKQPRMSRATRRVMCGFAAGDAGPARSLSAGIGQCREKCRPVLCPRQTLYGGFCCQAVSEAIFLSYFLGRFLCSTRDPRFSVPTRSIAKAGARRSCQGWPLHQPFHALCACQATP